LGISVAFLLALAGCGNDDNGGDSSQPSSACSVTAPTGKSPIRLTASTSAQVYADLKPVVKVGSAVVSGAPVVCFSMADADNNPIIGFGSTSKSSTATVASYPNLAFSLAKLVPGSDGGPSKWVSYIVTTVPTTTAAAAPTRPSTDNTGTLVDNGDGTYKYTFYRDVTQIKAQVDAMTVTAPNNKADLGDLSYDASKTHRLTIQVSGNAPGTGTNTANGVQVVAGVPMKNAVDVIYDFVPATGKPVTSADASRDIAANAACNDCHSTLGGIPGDSSESSGAGFHGGSRNNVQYCVVCHTDQRRYGRTEATYNAATLTLSGSAYLVDGRAIGNLPNLIHKTHLGHLLAKKGYDYAGVTFNEVGYPQDIRNCQKCHDGSDTATYKTAQGNNWKTVPTRLACGSCHDGIDFATGKGVTLADAEKGLTSSPYGHVGGAASDDKMCASCHSAANIDTYHLPVTPPNTQSALHVSGGSANTNSAWIASNTSRLPAGAIKVSYDIKSVSRNASKQPVMVFRMLQNGARKDLNAFASAAVNPATGAKEIWDNFMGSPSVYFVFAVPQDGIAAPADFNASVSGYLRCIWNGTAGTTACAGTSSANPAAVGTLTGPDADGYYTVTMTGVQIPDNAKMLTGGLGYSYNVTSTQPLTQTNVTGYPVSAPTNNQYTNKIGGLVVITPNVQVVATGYTGRRAIVEDKRCNACHQELGTFTAEAFHGGQRNDGTTCSWCHTPNRTSSGWSADSTSFVHAIHAGAKRTKPYTWHSVSATDNYSEIKYPGILARCEQCHVPDTYNFATSASAAAAPNRQYRYVATGTLSATDISLSPYVTAGVNYGLGFSFCANSAASGNCGSGTSAVAPQATRENADTTLVTSPTATVCSACHDSDQAQAHMSQNGGSLYLTRALGLQKEETCLLCHGSGKLADIKAVHAR
jgi:OmcA/MtrC family decaheme c-type cytochrome